MFRVVWGHLWLFVRVLRLFRVVRVFRYLGFSELSTWRQGELSKGRVRHRKGFGFREVIAVRVEGCKRLSSRV